MGNNEGTALGTEHQPVRKSPGAFGRPQGLISAPEKPLAGAAGGGVPVFRRKAVRNPKVHLAFRALATLTGRGTKWQQVATISRILLRSPRAAFGPD